MEEPHKRSSMSENKNAKTPADGPDYERGFVDGMQHQMKSSVDKAINKQPTKIFGPNLKEVLNSAGFYKKREWQGLTGDEARKFYEKYTDREELIHAIDKFLEEKNNG